MWMPVAAQGNLVVRTVYILSTLPGLLLRESGTHAPIPWLSPGTHQEQDIREGSQCQSLFDRTHLSKAQAELGGDGELPEEPLLSTAETYLLLAAEGFISAFCLQSDLTYFPISSFPRMLLSCKGTGSASKILELCAPPPHIC